MELHESFVFNPDYVNALVDLVNLCRKNEVKVKEYGTINNGFQLRFEGLDGDAVIHDFSYGHECGEWETYKMPWDYGDVSILTAEELVQKVASNRSTEPASSKMDDFLNSYKEMTAALKAEVARDIKREEELYGN